MNTRDRFIEDKVKKMISYFIKVGIYGIDSSVIKGSLEEAWDKATVVNENEIDPYRAKDAD